MIVKPINLSEPKTFRLLFNDIKYMNIDVQLVSAMFISDIKQTNRLQPWRRGIAGRAQGPDAARAL